MRSAAFALGLTALVALTGCADPDASDDAPMEQAGDVEARARAIHERVITIDTHDDIPSNFASDEVDPLNADRQVTIEKMEAGGLDVAFFIVYVGQGSRDAAGYAEAEDAARTKFEAIHRMADRYPDRIELATSPEDIERIVGGGKLAAAIGIENGYVIGKDLELLQDYYDLGARYITLAHGGHNDIADSATPRENLGDAEEEHGGLSAFGEEVVAEMNRLGIMVDVSHISKNAALDAMRVSRAPVIASHSSTRVVADHPRNMDDETLRALRDNGGVMQTVALGGYVKVRPEYDAARDSLLEAMGLENARGVQGLDGAQRAEFDQAMDDLETRWPAATVSDFVDHIDHAVELIGVDHVGISSDFDGGGGITGWNDASESENVTLELVRRGYSEEDIAKLWGGNVLRVWREVERVAAEPDGGEGA